MAMVSALYSVEKTGVGRDVEVSLFDTAYSMLTYLAAWNLNRAFEPKRYPGSSHQTLVPVQTFRTSDGYITIFCGKEKFWKLLCAAFGDSELADDPRFATFADRFQNREAVVERVQEHFSRRTTDEWLSLLSGRVPCAPVRTISDALADPEAKARGDIVEVQHPFFGKVREVNTPVRFPGEPLREHIRAPSLGEHTDTVLKKYLRYSDERVEQLRRIQAV
jgi:crotonobetainyl-CoA:carnitine CoA-transferase CaiB-like acyl-CoA transferase